MDDEKFARYQEQVVEEFLENQRSATYKGPKIHETTASTDRIRSSLSELRSSAIEARNKQLNNYPRRKPVGKKNNSISKRVKRERKVFGYKYDEFGEVVPLNPYPPEPLGQPWRPPQPYRFTPYDGTNPLPEDSFLRHSPTQAKISSDIVTHKSSKASSGLAEVLSDTVNATSNSTKEKIAGDTLRAIEVVQSKKLGYAAVAAGAGALVFGMANRKRNKKEFQG